MKRILAIIALLLYANPAWAAITDVGALLNINENTSDTNLSGTTSAQLDANNIGIFILTTDNACDTGAGAPSTTANEHTAATIDGNAMTKIREVCHEVDDPGGAGNGATLSVWIYRATANLALGVTVTFTLSGAQTAKAALGREVGVTAGATLTSAGATDAANDSIDPSSMTLSSLTSKEYLFVRAIASETDSNGTFTVTTDYTDWGLAEGTGVGAANMQARAESRVLTATGDTSNPTLFAGDFVNTYIAFQETGNRRPVVPIIFQ